MEFAAKNDLAALVLCTAEPHSYATAVAIRRHANIRPERRSAHPKPNTRLAPGRSFVLSSWNSLNLVYDLDFPFPCLAVVAHPLACPFLPSHVLNDRRCLDDPIIPKDDTNAEMRRVYLGKNFLHGGSYTGSARNRRGGGCQSASPVPRMSFHPATPTSDALRINFASPPAKQAGERHHQSW
jgi:hypothetical protein